MEAGNDADLNWSSKLFQQNPSEASNDRIKNRILAAIHTHVREAARIALEGGVAVVVLDPKGKEAHEAARIAGWNSQSNATLFELDDRVREMMIRNTDTVTSAWLSGRRPSHSRILVFIDYGSVLLNFVPARGYYYEPGSLERERV